MKVIDANIHLPKAPNDVHELDFNSFDVLNSIKSLDTHLKKNNVKGGCVSILDTNFIKGENKNILELLKTRGFKAVTMIDPSDKNWKNNVLRAKELGFIGIKFHSYIQRIDSSFDKRIMDICKFASDLGLLITICCSYGTKDLYKFNGVRIISELLNEISTPILALHAGGKKILDLMLIAEQSSNIYIDLSFSLSYYLGSSIENDIAFSINKLGSERWLYGSDHPYVDMKLSIKNIMNFFSRNKFSKNDIQNIMYKNGSKFFDV